jgi:acetate kinase
MNEAKSNAVILVINGGSSSIKFALYTNAADPKRLLSGLIERVGTPKPEMTAKDKDGKSQSVALSGGDHGKVVKELIGWIKDRLAGSLPVAVGHRIVHGGPRYSEAQKITPDVMGELHRLAPFAPNHLPSEIDMIEAFSKELPDVTQIACFDTAFHHDLPDVARLLPVPRRFEAMGVRRYGFHGLSYAYLMGELERLAGPAAARGRVILAHLGNGASLAAVRDGKSIDTSMGFTPSGGIVMGTRTGDVDPGLLAYLAKTQKLSADQLEELTSKQSGLLGLSEVGPDMRDLLARETTDQKCAQAVAVFCYTARKFIGAYAAALGGLETLVFSGGIGEHAWQVRERICAGLEFLGIAIDSEQNEVNKVVISSRDSRVTVRVIPTDEEVMIAREVFRVVARGS